jgi:hypothetical protein
MTCRQAHGGNEGVRIEYRTLNWHRSGRNDREQRSLSPEGLGPKAFRSNVRDACFPKRFWALNNIVKYDGKTNPCIWLENYCLACRTYEADSNLFIIQFLPIYLTDTLRAWLDHLPKNSIDC